MLMIARQYSIAQRICKIVKLGLTDGVVLFATILNEVHIHTMLLVFAIYNLITWETCLAKLLNKKRILWDG